MSVHVFLNDTYADWELGYLLPELVADGRGVLSFGIRRERVTSMGSLTVTPDTVLEEVDPETVEALILPGGLFWKDFQSPALDSLVKGLVDRKIPIAAICAATGYVASLGMLDSIGHTSNSVEFLKERASNYKGEARYRDEMAVTDSGLVTAGGLGAVDFTHQVLGILEVGSPKEREIWYQAFKFGEEPSN